MTAVARPADDPAVPVKSLVSDTCDPAGMLVPRYRWRYPDRTPIDDAYVAAVESHGGSPLLARVLARRGVRLADLEGFFGEPAVGLHDPGLLPDAAAVVRRVAAAREAAERVMVVGDFDADGLTGLAILATALRRLGLDVAAHVPSRVEDGHGLSLRAVEMARDVRRSLLLTVDTGTSSVTEVAAAAALGIDVVITDHHRVPDAIPPAIALVNPHRSDSAYPDSRLAGSGVALKLAALLLERLAGVSAIDTTAELADLAVIGTVADVAPIVGENRAIARLGLDRLRNEPRPGVAALLARAGVEPAAVTLETISYAIAPRLNAAGRVGDAGAAATLLMAVERSEADALAAGLELANTTRRDATRSAVEEARAIAAAEPDGLPATVIRGPWPVGIVGLVAARLADERGRPAVVAAEMGATLRASCRAPEGHDLASLLASCDDLLLRHGGHRGAAGLEVCERSWGAFRERFLGLVASAAVDPRPELVLDLALPARAADYRLLEHLAPLGPTGPGNPDPLVGVHGLTVTRIRAAAGGHAQLTLRRERDVVDAIAFERGDLVETLKEGDVVDVAGRLVSRRFGGFETLQILVLDVAPARFGAAVPGTMVRS